MDSFFDLIRRTGFRRGPDRILGGVCAGIARQLGLDVWIVRLVVAVLLLLPVLSWVVYAIAWLLLPWQDGTIPLQSMLTGSARPQNADRASGVEQVPHAQDR
ncbi:MAG TPA: hypothetical protein DHV14_02050 [Micrococcales bacterium]|uniref:PspC domain-containing protein n=1 Tax=Miniimonas TaxID=947525 RepID=UPI000D52A6F6|nr:MULTISPECIES: PspC domain-containing protein [Miniimonas]HCX83922.1 hypothetical protein [Micrococcales bacterium]